MTVWHKRRNSNLLTQIFVDFVVFRHWQETSWVSHKKICCWFVFFKSWYGLLKYIHSTFACEYKCLPKCMNHISFFHGSLRCFMTVIELININDQIKNIFPSDLQDYMLFWLVFCTAWQVVFATFSKSHCTDLEILRGFFSYCQNK